MPRLGSRVRIPFSAHSAGWQSGYAAACKAVDAGSIPTPASNRPGGEIGRRKGLKIPRDFILCRFESGPGHFTEYCMFITQFLFGSKHNQLLNSARLWVVLSVSFGLALLIVLSSIFNGFEHDVRQSFYADKAHIFVYDSQSTNQVKLENMPHIKKVQAHVSVPVMVSHRKLTQFIMLAQKDDVSEGQVSLPYHYASLLSVRDGDVVKASALNKSTLLPYPVHSDYVVSINQKSVAPIANVRSLGAFAQIKSTRSGWWLWISDLSKKSEVLAELNIQGLGTYNMDVHLQHLLATLHVQKSMMLFVFLLVVILLFTQLMSMLRQVMNSFISHVAYLRVSGVSHSKNMLFLMKINLSIIMGTMVLGLLVGLVVSYWATDLCATLEWLLGINIMSKSAFMLDYLPSRINVFEVAIICFIFVGVSTLMLFRLAKSATAHPVTDVFRGHINA